MLILTLYLILVIIKWVIAGPVSELELQCVEIK